MQGDQICLFLAESRISTQNCDAAYTAVTAVPHGHQSPEEKQRSVFYLKFSLAWKVAIFLAKNLVILGDVAKRNLIFLFFAADNSELDA